MNRTAVLSLLIVSSCVFLLFQLHYYRKYVSKVSARKVLLVCVCCCCGSRTLRWY